MSFSDDVKSGVSDVLNATWATRDGTVVPTTDDIVLKNGAVNVDATYLYADLADSSSLGQKLKKTVAAKIVRSYLNATTRILKKYDGEIRSFDGDRVLAIFIGQQKNTNAVRAALALNWAVEDVLKPQIKTQWSTVEDYWTAAHGVGIDTGEAMLVRGGVRDSNDIVSIGSAPNVAAKLSELRCHKTHITMSVYNDTSESNRIYGDEKMWTTHDVLTLAGKQHDVCRSNWKWAP